MSIHIHHPKRGTRVGPKFAAFGLTKPAAGELPISGVIGRLIDNNGGREIPGKTVLFRSRKGMGEGKHCWVILFTGAVAGARYTLEVTGLRADGKLTKFFAEPEVEAVMLDAIGTSYPSSGTTLTADEKEYFVAYGETSAVTVLALSASLGTVQADYVDTSPSDQVWWATFPPLIAGIYTFLVEDTTMHSSTAINVTVP